MGSSPTATVPEYLVHVGGTLSRSLCSDVEEHTGEYNDNVY